MHSYWQKQSSSEPLFPDIEWNRPQRASQAGRLTIIGGNKASFATVSAAYQTAAQLSVGQVRVVLPESLKDNAPKDLLDVVYAPANASGGFSRNATSELLAGLQWGNHTLLVGDLGRSSETAICLADLLAAEGDLTITRDAFDLLSNNLPDLVDRQGTTLILSFAQLQKLFKAVYYPKVITFSMQLTTLIEALHKFSITYPVSLVTFHQNQLIAAHQGQVVTQEFDQPMLIWRGITATKAACYQIWSPSQPLETIASSWQV